MDPLGVSLLKGSWGYLPLQQTAAEAEAAADITIHHFFSYVIQNTTYVI